MGLGGGTARTPQRPARQPSGKNVASAGLSSRRVAGEGVCRPGGGNRCDSSSCHNALYLPGTCRPEHGTRKLHIIGAGGGGSSELRYDTAEIILEERLLIRRATQINL